MHAARDDDVTYHIVLSRQWETTVYNSKKKKIFISLTAAEEKKNCEWKKIK